MKFLEFYIVWAIGMGVLNTYDYVKNIEKVDPRFKQVGKFFQIAIVFGTFIISTVFAPIVVIDMIVKEVKKKGANKNG